MLTSLVQNPGEILLKVILSNCSCIVYVLRGVCNQIFIFVLLIIIVNISHLFSSQLLFAASYFLSILLFVNGNHKLENHCWYHQAT
jgi:hypothetical protein